MKVIKDPHFCTLCHVRRPWELSAKFEGNYYCHDDGEPSWISCYELATYNTVNPPLQRRSEPSWKPSL
jgi:hypothetical protein